MEQFGMWSCDDGEYIASQIHHNGDIYATSYSSSITSDGQSPSQIGMKPKARRIWRWRWTTGSESAGHPDTSLGEQV